MIKRIFIIAIISFFLASNVNAWEMDTYVENAQADEGIKANSTKKTSETQTAKTDEQNNTLTSFSGISIRFFSFSSPSRMMFTVAPGST